MKIEAVLVSFRVDGNEKTNETSGVLFNKNTVLIPGTCLMPLVQQEEWISPFVKASSQKLRPSKHLNKVLFRVFVESEGQTEKEKASKEFHCLESEAVGVWKCPLVADSLKKLFYDWTVAHGNFDRNSGVLSSDYVDLSKELMSVLILLRCEAEPERDTTQGDDCIRALVNLTSSLQSPSRGQEVEVVSTPFGNEHFMNSLSRGLISNVVGYQECIILSDARTVSGCEGGPIFISRSSREKLLGLVTCPLTWWRGEWVGFTIGISLAPVLNKLLKTENGSITNEEKSHTLSSDLLPLNFIDETVLLVRSETSWGSGVILSAASGIIITCSHVVKNDNTVTVSYKGHQYPADVVFNSQDEIAYDLAVIKIGNNSVFQKEARFSKHPAEIGESVIAAGFPFFSERDDVHIRPSIAAGCISRVNPYMIQTTCCIQSGFSGGGLFRNGELIGIIASNVKESSTGALFPHINFVVPSSVFEKHVLKYIKTGDLRSLRNLLLLLAMQTCNGDGSSSCENVMKNTARDPPRKYKRAEGRPSHPVVFGKERE